MLWSRSPASQGSRVPLGALCGAAAPSGGRRASLQAACAGPQPGCQKPVEPIGHPSGPAWGRDPARGVALPAGPAAQGSSAGPEARPDAAAPRTGPCQPPRRPRARAQPWWLLPPRVAPSCRLQGAGPALGGPHRPALRRAWLSRLRPAAPPLMPSPRDCCSTPPFSSEDDSDGDQAQRGSLRPPQARPPTAPRAEDSWDCSDSDTPEGAGALASSGTLVQSMVRNLEKQLEAPAKKPVGGVRLFLMPSTGPQRATVPGGKLQVSEDESDLEISSLEDLPQDLDPKEKLKPSSCLQFPEKCGAGAWSAGQPRVPGW
ncbi:cilium assembly protein DZIP1L-like [Tamandua tetradactyla]|uniref:cilium assembly protein DZIP1L-like n=1 Tax=Tamandua tetradactyla TaxID=48850 RepID=UPI0040541C13